MIVTNRKTKEELRWVKISPEGYMYYTDQYRLVWRKCEIHCELEEPIYIFLKEWQKNLEKYKTVDLIEVGEQATFYCQTKTKQEKVSVPYASEIYYPKVEEFLKEEESGDDYRIKTDMLEQIVKQAKKDDKEYIHFHLTEALKHSTDNDEIFMGARIE